MVVKNEENRFLEQMLLSAKAYVDFILIIDDASTDNTVAICEKVLTNFPHKIIKNHTSLFENETNLRTFQWQETLKLNPNWILILDADELFEDTIFDKIEDLLQTTKDAIYFRLFDFWSETHYRDDALWYAHRTYRPFMMRNKESMAYSFKDAAQHCGRFPLEITQLSYELSDIRLKHLGWSREIDRKNKFERYLQLDPNGEFGNMHQYLSICDENPNLKPFD